MPAGAGLGGRIDPGRDPAGHGGRGRVHLAGGSPWRPGTYAAAARRRDRPRRRGSPVHVPAGPGARRGQGGSSRRGRGLRVPAVQAAESAYTAEAFMANSHVMYAWVLEEQDRLAEAFETVGRLRTLAGDKAESPIAVQIERWRARAYFAAGRWDEAVVELDSVPQLYDADMDRWPEPFALRALIAVHRGQLDTARADLARFDAALAAGGRGSVLDLPVLARAFLLEADGQVAEAIQVLTCGWEVAEAAPSRWPSPQSAHTWPGWPPRPAIWRRHTAWPRPSTRSPRPTRRGPPAGRGALGDRSRPVRCRHLLEAVKLQQAAARPFDLAMFAKTPPRPWPGRASSTRPGNCSARRWPATRSCRPASAPPPPGPGCAPRLAARSSGRRQRPATGWAP